METLENNKSEFDFTIIGAPDYGYVEVKIPSNGTLKVEASAMATMDTNIEMKTKMRGGLGRLFTGESLFINEFTAKNSSGTIGIAPASPGDIKQVNLSGDDVIFLQNSLSSNLYSELSSILMMVLQNIVCYSGREGTLGFLLH